MLARALPALLVAFLLASAAAPPPSEPATAAPPSVHIVVVGASNTHGFYIEKSAAYPALLEDLLRAQGFDARVKNAGRPFDTTGKMRKRLDKDVPDGTDLVILHPGQNDRFLFYPERRRAANIAAMRQSLRARAIIVLLYEDEVGRRYYGFDGIHLTPEGHAAVAAALLPRVLTLLAAPAAP